MGNNAFLQDVWGLSWDGFDGQKWLDLFNWSHMSGLHSGCRLDSPVLFCVMSGALLSPVKLLCSCVIPTLGWLHASPSFYIQPVQAVAVGFPTVRRSDGSRVSYMAASFPQQALCKAGAEPAGSVHRRLRSPGKSFLLRLVKPVPTASAVSQQERNLRLSVGGMPKNVWLSFTCHLLRCYFFSNLKDELWLELIFFKCEAVIMVGVNYDFNITE